MRLKRSKLPVRNAGTNLVPVLSARKRRWFTITCAFRRCCVFAPSGCTRIALVVSECCFSRRSDGYSFIFNFNFFFATAHFRECN